jgi:hypothetical protein
MRNLFLILLTLSLAACGSGEGSGQADNDSIMGSAVLQNFSASSVVPNVCRNFAVPTDSVTCATNGGTWSSRPSYSVTSGSIDYSTYAAMCTLGTPSTTCRLGGISFNLTAGLSLDAVNACEAQGGIVEVACLTSNGTENYCAINPNNSSDCTALGGAFYSSLNAVTGSVSSEQLVAGNNIFQILTNYPTLDAVDVMASNPQNPVYLSFTIKIHDALGFGSTFWSSAMSRTTSNAFDNIQGYPTFSLVMPLAVDGTYISIDTANLYFQ